MLVRHVFLVITDLSRSAAITVRTELLSNQLASRGGLANQSLTGFKGGVWPKLGSACPVHARQTRAVDVVKSAYMEPESYFKSVGTLEMRS